MNNYKDDDILFIQFELKNYTFRYIPKTQEFQVFKYGKWVEKNFFEERRKGYSRCCVYFESCKRTSIQKHRLVYYAYNTKTFDFFDSSKNNFIDHIDMNPRNNHISNLRKVTHSQNIHNNNFLGVSFKKERKKWLARIRFNGKRKFLGYFENKEEAIEVRRKYKESLNIFG